jgi:hypothetical protein
MNSRILTNLAACLALAAALLSPALAETASTPINTITLDTRNADYGSWIQEAYPGSTDPAVIAPTADPDRDGIPNSVEMVLGGQPAAASGSGLLPTANLEMLDIGNGPVEYFVFSYRRTSRSLVAGCQGEVQHSTGLTEAWEVAEDNVAGVKVLTDPGFHGGDTDRVRVYIPRNGRPTIFGRLRVTMLAVGP